MTTAATAPFDFQPHIIRQEGFTPPPLSGHTPPPFGGMPSHYGHPDLNDELASLMSNERSTQSPGSAYESDNSGYRPHTHNIFDISAPSTAHHHHNSHSHHHVGSASSTSSSFPSHFSLPNNNGSNASNGSGSPGLDGHGPQYTANFNSTLPAINSSMRYDPHPPYIPSPSSFRSPSPHSHQHSRSRSRSRPPSSHLASTPAGGPTRTTRTRRNGSISSTSPPPRPVPQAIVIPGSNGNRGYTQGWFGPDYPHATPESLPSLTSLPSLPSLGSLNSIHSHQHIGSPHSLHSPHTLNSPHPFHQHHSTYPASNPNNYGSPVETKFGGMALNGGLAGSLGNGGQIHGGMPASLPSTTPQTNGAPEPTAKQTVSDKAALLANEKRRRRRESHNAVERRRRDNINEKISELATLIPECMLEEGTTASGKGGKDADEKEDSKDGVKDGGSPTSANATVVKANKGMILRKSVEYIRYLQQLVTAQGARNRELEEQLKGLGFRGSSASGSEASPPPSLSDTNELLNGSGLGLGLGVWGLASMPEDDDVDVDGLLKGEGELHTLDSMIGMDIEDDLSMEDKQQLQRERGRKATRGAVGLVKNKVSPRKTKKLAPDDDGEDSDLSDSMDV
ncbi:BHLH domain-containing protein [Mycena indigotica]|uniref:BHLH domain-containing protein n=1 Tax=Mycena indigotica TaxID=2126181 RepID=A0A8H6S558_9AGAR|nr:BHLH domain-containing protein [Mycena indigotica]KAF7292002.1 BHLH domain-containing protein [Mycena indigotica]